MSKWAPVIWPLRLNMHCQCLSELRELLILVAAVILPVIVLIPYCILFVTTKADTSDATTRQQKHCHSCKKAGRKTWKPSRRPPPKKPAHNDSCCSRTHDQSLAKTNDQSRPINKKSETLYDLYHTVYSKVLDEGNPNPQERTFYILVHSKHDKAAREAKQNLKGRNIDIIMQKQILSVTLPNRFSVRLLCNDLISGPPQIDLDIGIHCERVLKIFTVSIKKPDEMKKVPERVQIKYNVSSFDSDEPRAFCFPWLSKKPSATTSEHSQPDKYVLNASGKESIAYQCNTYYCCSQHCSTSFMKDISDRNDHDQIPDRVFNNPHDTTEPCIQGRIQRGAVGGRPPPLESRFCFRRSMRRLSLV